MHGIYQVAEKYPTGQNAISQQPCEIFISKFPHFTGDILLQFEIFLNNLCHFYPKLWLFKY